jgi:hypothetical protein
MNLHRTQCLALAMLAATFVGPGAAGLAAQPVACHLSPTEDGLFSGECVTAQTRYRIDLARGNGATDALWQGTVEGSPRFQSIEIATYQYADGPELIVRTGAWHLASEFAVSGNGLRISWDERVEAPPSEVDFQIFEAARAILDGEAVWDRADDRNCENDDGLVSVYCALARATASAMGRYQHRQPAMQAVRRVIAAEWPERIVDHRLMNFNNDARTTLRDVERLFDLAAESLRGSIR